MRVETSRSRSTSQRTGTGVTSTSRGEPRRGRTLTAKGERRRTEILEASAELFDRLGYHHATIALIADEIGTTKANVYHYFRAKHDILFAIHQAWIDDLILRFDEHTAHQPEVADQLRAVIHDVLGVVASRRSQVRVFFEYVRELPEPLRRQAHIRRDEYTDRVEGVLARGMDEGVLRTAPLRVTTLGLFGLANWTYQWFRPDGPHSADEVADQLFDLFWRGAQAEGTA